jgi:hypothetical protein
MEHRNLVSTGGTLSHAFKRPGKECQKAGWRTPALEVPISDGWSTRRHGSLCPCPREIMLLNLPEWHQASPAIPSRFSVGTYLVVERGRLIKPGSSKIPLAWHDRPEDPMGFFAVSMLGSHPLTWCPSQWKSSSQVKRTPHLSNHQLFQLLGNSFLHAISACLK